MEKPRVGCAVIIRNELGHILMARRAKEPFFGYWIIPGGGVDFLEAFESTAKREMQEELGVNIANVQFFTVREIINPPKEHRIVLYCVADIESGNITASSDVSEARFMSKQELQNLETNEVTPTVSSVIQEVIQRLM